MFRFHLNRARVLTSWLTNSIAVKFSKRSSTGWGLEKMFGPTAPTNQPTDRLLLHTCFGRHDENKRHNQTQRAFEATSDGRHVPSRSRDEWKRLSYRLGDKSLEPFQQARSQQILRKRSNNQRHELTESNGRSDLTGDCR